MVAPAKKITSTDRIERATSSENSNSDASASRGAVNDRHGDSAISSENSDLQAAFKRIAAADTGVTMLRCDARNVELGAGRGVTIDGQERYRLSDDCFAKVLRAIRLPSDVDARLDPDLRQRTRRCLWNQEVVEQPNNVDKVLGRKLQLAIRGDDVIAFVPTRDAYLSNRDIINVVGDVLSPVLGDLTPSKVEIHSTGAFQLRLVTAKLQVEPRVNDVVCGGISISHSPLGERATQIRAYLFRLVCKNGLISPVDISARGKSGKLKNDRIRVNEGLQHADVRKRLATVVERCWANLDGTLRGLERLASERLTIPAAEFLTAFGKERRLSIRATNAIVEALRQDEAGPIEGNGTLFDIVNSISRVGTHSPDLPNSAKPLSLRVLSELQAYAGSFLAWDHPNACPKCKRLIRGNTE